MTLDPINKDLKALLERVATWPDEDQRELLKAAIEIEIRRCGSYHASVGELKSIDEALDDIAKGAIATEDEVEDVVAKYRQP